MASMRCAKVAALMRLLLLLHYRKHKRTHLQPHACYCHGFHALRKGGCADALMLLLFAEQTITLTCSLMPVIAMASMRCAKTAALMRLPTSRMTQFRCGNRRATHVSTIIHLAAKQRKTTGNLRGTRWKG
jgi:hypothetical protein